MNKCMNRDCLGDCDTCQKPKHCALPVIEVEEMPNSITSLRFNVNGVSTWYDYGNMINQTQTDTVLIADAINRLVKYQAERHTDVISAKELGAVLHVADLGDVDITDVEDNSFFVYKKDNDCASGCQGISNSWIGWNSLDHQTTSGQYPMVFDENGKPLTVSTPTSTDQYYQLGWNAGNKISWGQPKEVSTPPQGTDNKVLKVYLDPTTKELVFVRSDP